MKYKAWGLHALRHYPFSQKADDIVGQLIERDSSGFYVQKNNHFHKTALDLVVNTQFLNECLLPSNSVDAIFYKYILKYYGSWLKYGRPMDNKPTDLDLTIFLEQKYKNEHQVVDSMSNIFNIIDSENMSYLLHEFTGDVNLSKNKSEILSIFVKSPIAKNAMKSYQYYLSGMEEIDGIPAYEIAFFSKKPIDNTFEGYLYVSVKDFSLLKAVFTLNYSARHNGVNEMLFTHLPEKKENLFYIGDDSKVGLLLNKTEIRSGQNWDSFPPLALTPSEQEISGLIEEAGHTRAFRNLQKAGALLLTDKIGIVDNKLEIGLISHTIHYNELEGLRLRLGGNTTEKLNRHIQTGGYLAYGFGDNQLKYRGNMRYSYGRDDQLHFTYVQDLNLLGCYNLLDDKRDNILLSFFHSGERVRSMSLQKIGQIKYERDFLNRFSAELSAKYIYDNPVENPLYPLVKNAEFEFSLRYAPYEKHVKLHNDRLIFQDADFDLSLKYRRGIKGIFGSHYNYRITSFNFYKRFYFPYQIGQADIRFSGGKVWDRVPFPILFIPTGNEGYFFENEDYNLMNYHEFVTDRYLSGDFRLTFNWSPINFIQKKSKIETTFGIKTIYGPLSDNNNPQLHSGLFPFTNNQIGALGKDPYTEVNIGLKNIFKFLRVEYVQRLHYLNQKPNQRNKSIFFSVSLDI